MKVSIIIATFNSALTLTKVLKSIRDQNFSQKLLEILIVDGGSTDKTLSIAKKFSCRIIHNPKIEPVNAKLLGFENSKGKYIVYLDADEEIANENSIKTKYKILESENNMRAVIGTGYRDPIKSSIISKYINEFGDPFSYFMMKKISKNEEHFLKDMQKEYYLKRDTDQYMIFKLNKYNELPIVELGAANSMIDREYTKKRFPKFDEEVFAHWYYLLLKSRQEIAITKNDPVIHHSTESLGKYLKKIKWRIKNNIYHANTMGKAGFSGREKFTQKNSLKKYLFIPYALSIILPSIDALYLSFSRKNIRYLIHVFLCFYTVLLIIYHSIINFMGYKPKLKNYDETKTVLS